MLIHNPFGPIFEKELRATSRRKRSYVLRVVYLGGLLLFLVLNYVSMRDWGIGGVAQRVQQQNMLGQTFFVTFSIFCTGAMAMIGPVLTCTAISSERLHKTLHVLLMTPITSWQIITGKLFSRLLVALTLIGLSLPVLALVRLLGGVELRQMFGILAICTATALATASMGLFVSTFVNRAYAAILLSYAAILLLYAVIPIFIIVPLTVTGPPSWKVFALICSISPFFSAAFLSMPVGPLMSAPWWICALVQCGLALALVTTSAALVRRIQRREGASAADAAFQSIPLHSTTPIDTTKLAPSKPLTPTRRRTKPMRDNPVLWRELGRAMFPKLWQSRVAAIAIIALLLLSYGLFASAKALDDEELQCAYACVSNGVLWLMLSIFAATAIAQEKESDTWTLLLASPISGRQVVFGKIAGIYRRMIWPGALLLVHFSIFALAGVISWTAVLVALWIMFSFNTVWVATGVYFSLRLSKVMSAVIITLMLAIVLYVVFPILMVIFWQIFEFNERYLERMALLFPYYYLTDGMDRISPSFTLNQSIWMPAIHSATIGTLLMWVLLSGLIHLVLSGVIVLWTVNRFNRLVGRAGQTETLNGVDSSIKAFPAMG